MYECMYLCMYVCAGYDRSADRRVEAVQWRCAADQPRPALHHQCVFGDMGHPRQEDRALQRRLRRLQEEDSQRHEEAVVSYRSSINVKIFLPPLLYRL